MHSQKHLQLYTNIRLFLILVNSTANHLLFAMTSEDEVKRAWEFARVDNLNMLKSCNFEQNAKIHEDGVDPQALIHIAAFSNSMECLKYLIEEKHDAVWTPNFNGYQALHFAAYSGRVEAVTYLLKRSAPVSAKTVDGKTPLHIAALRGHIDVVNVLLDNKADVDICDSQGFTPLFDAIIGNHKDVADVLISRGANTHHMSADKVTPAMIAGKYKRAWFAPS